MSEIAGIVTDTSGDNPWVRHNGGANYAYCDSHAKWLRPENIMCQPGDHDPAGGHDACPWSIK